MIKSYSQNFEDVILSRVFRDIKNGFYVDVGASHPVIDSVTCTFYENGWNGINIEPIESQFRLFCDQRIRDVNINCAAGALDSEGELHITLGVGGLSTLDTTIAKNYNTMQIVDKVERVQIRTLNSILDESAPNQIIHFLKIDVEGMEKDVLDGLDLKRHRPIVLCIEAINPITKLDNWNLWQNKIIESHYFFAYEDGLNRFFLRRENIELLKFFTLPPNIHDNFEVVKHSYTIK